MHSKSARRGAGAFLTTAGLALLAMLALDEAASAASREGGRDGYEPARRGGAAMLAVVSIAEQRITIYDSTGKMLQAPVSTGSTGYETPAGIFSVVQKKVEHNSNLYQDGNMPFMQRITWTGIALHAGVLPGYPASHGCVRMPIGFAQRLFDATDIGMRVVLVRNDIAPMEFEHSRLPKSVAKQVDVPSRPSARKPTVGSPEHVQLLKSIASVKSDEAQSASRRASEARRAAARKAAEAASATKALRAAEAAQARAAAALKDAEQALEVVNAATTPSTPEAVKKAETAKEKAAARLAAADEQLRSARIQEQAKIDAAAAASAEAKMAEDVRDAALDAAAEAERRTSPISVFISRKTQRFYVRQGHMPVAEGPISIQDPDKPIGSYIFTALSNTDNRVRWNVVSMYAAKHEAEPGATRTSSRKGDARRTSEATPADVEGAKAALDRIAMPHEAIQRISDVLLPGSSLIVSDEGLSIETGKDTDFVVVMSGEPQGALKIRQREPLPFDGWGSPYGYGKSPFGGGGFFWKY